MNKRRVVSVFLALVMALTLLNGALPRQVIAEDLPDTFPTGKTIKFLGAHPGSSGFTILLQADHLGISSTNTPCSYEFFIMDPVTGAWVTNGDGYNYAVVTLPSNGGRLSVEMNILLEPGDYWICYNYLSSDFYGTNVFAAFNPESIDVAYFANTQPLITPTSSSMSIAPTSIEGDDDTITVMADTLTITPATVNMERENKIVDNKNLSTQTFTATVTATGAPAIDNIVWTVEGSSGYATQMTGALLTVGEDEIHQTLTVRATSTDDPTLTGTAVVTVLNPQTLYNYSQDFGVWEWRGQNSGTVQAIVDADPNTFQGLDRYYGTDVDRLNVSGPDDFIISATSDGRTVITLNFVFLNTLQNGDHKFEARFEGGRSKLIPLSVNRVLESSYTPSSNTMPFTADSTLLLLSLVPTLFLLGIIFLTTSWRKRRRLEW